MATKKDTYQLTMTPRVAAKIFQMQDAVDTEVGGFGVSSPDNFLHLEDFIVLEQEATTSSFEWTDDAVGKYMEAMQDSGKALQQYSRIWIHTHPPSSGVSPSFTDETTQKDCFGLCSWSVMLIVGTGGEFGARLYSHYTSKSPIDGSDISNYSYAEIPCSILFNTPYEGVTQAELDSWTATCKTLVKPPVCTIAPYDTNYNKAPPYYNSKHRKTTKQPLYAKDQKLDTSLTLSPTKHEVSNRLLYLKKFYRISTKGHLVKQHSGQIADLSDVDEITLEAAWVLLSEFSLKHPRDVATNLFTTRLERRQLYNYALV